MSAPPSVLPREAETRVMRRSAASLAGRSVRCMVSVQPRRRVSSASSARCGCDPVAVGSRPRRRHRRCAGDMPASRSCRTAWPWNGKVSSTGSTIMTRWPRAPRAEMPSTIAAISRTGDRKSLIRTASSQGRDGRPGRQVVLERTAVARPGSGPSSRRSGGWRGAPSGRACRPARRPRRRCRPRARPSTRARSIFGACARSEA